MVGAAIMVVGIYRTVARRHLPAFRGGVATTVMGSGIAAFGFALLILGIGSFDLIGVFAALMVGTVGVGQLVFANVIRRSGQGGG